MNHRMASIGVAAALLGASWAASAGGVKAGALQHRRCLASTCTVLVTYGATGTTGNNCGISVPDVIFIFSATNTVQWKLMPSTGGLPVHRFRAGRVTIDDNNDDPNEAGGSGSNAVFSNGALQDDSKTDPKDLVTPGRSAVKVFTYSIAVEREKSGGGWEDCDLIDPIAVNRGG